MNIPYIKLKVGSVYKLININEIKDIERASATTTTIDYSGVVGAGQDLLTITHATDGGSGLGIVKEVLDAVVKQCEQSEGKVVELNPSLAVSGIAYS